MLLIFSSGKISISCGGWLDVTRLTLWVQKITQTTYKNVV